MKGTSKAPYIQIRWAATDLPNFETHPLSSGITAPPDGTLAPTVTDYRTVTIGGDGSGGGGGMSDGARIGVGVGVGLAGLAMIFAAGFFIYRYRQKNKKPEATAAMHQQQGVPFLAPGNQGHPPPPPNGGQEMKYGQPPYQQITPSPVSGWNQPSPDPNNPQYQQQQYPYPQYNQQYQQPNPQVYSAYSVPHDQQQQQQQQQQQYQKSTPEQQYQPTPEQQYQPPLAPFQQTQGQYPSSLHDQTRDSTPPTGFVVPLPTGSPAPSHLYQHQAHNSHVVAAELPDAMAHKAVTGNVPVELHSTEARYARASTYAPTASELGDSSVTTGLLSPGGTNPARGPDDVTDMQRQQEQYEAQRQRLKMMQDLDQDQQRIVRPVSEIQGHPLQQPPPQQQQQQYHQPPY
jgi:hypothetical protein